MATVALLWGSGHCGSTGAFSTANKLFAQNLHFVQICEACTLFGSAHRQFGRRQRSWGGALTCVHHVVAGSGHGWIITCSARFWTGCLVLVPMCKHISKPGCKCLVRGGGAREDTVLVQLPCRHDRGEIDPFPSGHKTVAITSSGARASCGAMA